MVTLTDERNRILNMIETGQITAAQAAQLLDALVSEQQQPVERVRNRTVRIWMTDSATNSKKMHVTATMPINLISMILHLLTRMVPQLNDGTLQNLIRAIERGNTGRLLDLQDLEEGKRLEIFVEQ
jgi:Tfp pilus assembly ATPase PilU